MQINIHPSPEETGAAAAELAARTLKETINRQGEARLVLATGASQFDLLSNLVQSKDVDWSKVTCFHLDEYIGLPEDHPAGFRTYLRDRFTNQVAVRVFHYIQGESLSPSTECQRVGALIQEAPIDLALVGIGENGHLAFNDPPADFDIRAAYIVVDLDTACRQQQVGEGWFENLEAVPQQAISMTIQQIMQNRKIICTVPDQRKAPAVQAALEGPVTPNCPASILQEHADCSLFLDQPAASLLRNEPT